MFTAPPGSSNSLSSEKFILAIALPGVAGAVNASGFLALGTYTSHVTGHVARVGDEIAQHRYASAFMTLALVGVFFLGAATTAALVETAKRRARSRYAVPLLIQAAALTGVAFSSPTGAPQLLPVPTVLLCFAMGMQNAMVTKISGAVVRTTHLTGIVTDLGIEWARLTTWALGELRRKPLGGILFVVHRSFADPEWKKLRLHALIFSSFLTGAVLGPMLYLAVGRPAMMAPCAVLLGLAVFDTLTGIGIPLRPTTIPPK